MGTFILILSALTGLFLIFIILLQRGRGGGLAGALGGAGGQSAFGTKAGDVFTRITIGVAVFWVVLSCVAIFITKPADLYSGGAGGNAPGSEITSPGGEEAGDEATENDAPAGGDGDPIDTEAIEESAQPAPETEGGDAPKTEPEKTE